VCFNPKGICLCSGPKHPGPDCPASRVSILKASASAVVRHKHDAGRVSLHCFNPKGICLCSGPGSTPRASSTSSRSFNPKGICLCSGPSFHHSRIRGVYAFQS